MKFSNHMQKSEFIVFYVEPSIIFLHSINLITIKIIKT
jgi:hypothetical protein